MTKRFKFTVNDTISDNTEIIYFEGVKCQNTHHPKEIYKV